MSFDKLNNHKDQLRIMSKRDYRARMLKLAVLDNTHLDMLYCKLLNLDIYNK